MADDISPKSAGGDAKPPAAEPDRPNVPQIFKGLGHVLMQSLKEGDMHRSQGMIMGGVELTHRDIRGRTPLHVAIQKQAIGVVKLMISKKVDVNAQDRADEATPLHFAAAMGNVICIKHLLKAKANMNILSVDGETPLARAAGRGQMPVLLTFLKDMNCEIDVTERKENEYMKLEREALTKPPDTFGTYMDKVGRARSRSPSPKGSRSPKNKGAVVRNDLSPGRFWRDVHEEKRILKRERRNPVSPLLKAVKRNAKFEIVKQLLEAGSNPEREDEKLNRPLHCAAHYGNSNISRMLINAKAEVNNRNHLGRTPLHFAARTGHPRIIKMLLESKAEINAEDAYCQTPLAIACDTQMRKILKDAGGKVNMEAPEGGAHVSAPVSPDRSRSPSPGRSQSPPPMSKNKLRGESAEMSTGDVSPN